MHSRDFLTLLMDGGFDFFTGVPCSYFAGLVRALGERNDLLHVPAVREDLAMGLAAGAYLTGRMPVVYMQNSGFGYSLEVFASLNIIYHVPVLVVMSYRGPEDPGMEEHRVMGEHTEEVLRSFGLAYSVFDGSRVQVELDRMKNHLAEQNLPFVLLTRKGALE
jgi:sulfopyruvate decarboxylase subunit alpha